MWVISCTRFSQNTYLLKALNRHIGTDDSAFFNAHRVLTSELQAEETEGNINTNIKNPRSCSIVYAGIK